MIKTLLSCLFAAVLPLFSAAPALAQLPEPNHPILFGYYYADGRYGDFTSEVFGYTNSYIALPCGYVDLPSGCGPHQAFANSLANAANNSREIVLTMDSQSTWSWTLDYASPYWGRVKLIEVMSEQDLSAAATDSIVVSLKNLIAAKGLAPKRVGANYTLEQSLSTQGIFAPSLDYVSFEVYALPSQCSGVQGCTNFMNANIDQAKARIPAGKQIVLVPMAYDRNGLWAGDIGTLTDLQDVAYLKAYNDPRVVALSMFSYARPGGSRDHPELKARHQAQGALLMRWIRIDTPAGGTVTQPFWMGGWAVDLAASSGPGVDAIHVWAHPASGAPPIFMSDAYPVAGMRPDVGAFFFEDGRFSDSGWNAPVNGLGAGTYTLTAYAHSAVTGTFTHIRSVTVTVPSPQMNLDAPASGNVPSTFIVGGWAIDPAAASGTGVSTVHMWAVSSTGNATFLGASYGGDRPDVGNVFGQRFRYSGFGVVASLPPGSYTIVAYALSTVTNTFSNARSANVTVVP